MPSLKCRRYAVGPHAFYESVYLEVMEALHYSTCDSVIPVCALHACVSLK